MTVAKRLRWITDPAEVDPTLASALTTCWTRVLNAGGAVERGDCPERHAGSQHAAARHSRKNGRRIRGNRGHDVIGHEKVPQSVAETSAL